MPMLPRPLLALPATLFLSIATIADGDGRLAAGAAAPKLPVTSWVKGEAVSAFERGSVYVIDFWAPGTAYLFAHISRLSRLQRQYAERGLVVIGVSTADADTSLAKVKALVDERGERMAYRIAWDAEGAAWASYMTAAGKSGIPLSFVIDKEGRIAFIGPPMAILPVVLDCIEDRWDPATGRAKLRELYTEADRALKSSDPAAAIKIIERVGERSPAVLEVMSGELLRLLLRVGRLEEARKLGARLVEEGIEYDDDSRLNEVAWAIVDPALASANRDLKLARRAAEHAVAISKEKDGASLDTLARVEFSEGNLERAIEIQRKAIELAPDAEIAQERRGSLEEYAAALAAKTHR